MNNLKNSFACRIAQQGARPPSRNQVGVEKSSNGTTSTDTDLIGNLTETLSQRGPSDTENMSRNAKKTSRQRWTKEEYVQVMTALYEAKFMPMEGSNTEQTCRLWREKQPKSRPAIDANKLANVRSDIIKSKRLEEAVLQQLQNNIREKAEKRHISSSSSSSSNIADDDIQDFDMHHQLLANDPPDIEASNQTNTNHSAASNDINTMSEKVMIKLEELKHQELFDRIQLPKIRKDRKAKELIHKGILRLAN